MLLLILFSVILLSIYFAFQYYVYGNADYWPKKGVPFISSGEILSLWQRLQTPFHELDVIFYNKFKAMGKSLKLGGTLEFRRPIAFVTDLDLMRLIMVKDFDHFVNHSTLGRKEDPTLLHKMLFTMENAEWKNMRAALTPTFTTGKIKRMFEVFNESSGKMATFLKEEVRNSIDGQIEMKDVWGRYSMDVIASSAFGVDSQNFKEKNSMFYQMGHRFQAHFRGFKGTLRQFTAFFAPGLFEFFNFTFLDVKAFNFFLEVVQKTIKHRETTGEKRNDFLQLMMDAKNEKLSSDGDDLEISGKEAEWVDKGQKIAKVKWTDEDVAANSILFIFGGFDAIETLLIYVSYELALNPDVQERLYEDLEHSVQQHGKLNYEVVNELEYLDMVVSETLRKHPPAVRTERKCTKDYRVEGTDIVLEKDSGVTIPIYSIHHDPEIYPEPNRFIPERFTPEEKAKRHPYAYMPFGVGPRHCIAQRFAIIEGKAAIAHLVHNFRLAPSSKTTIPMKYNVSGQLKPANGMWLNVTPRN